MTTFTDAQVNELVAMLEDAAFTRARAHNDELVYRARPPEPDAHKKFAVWHAAQLIRELDADSKQHAAKLFELQTLRAALRGENAELHATIQELTAPPVFNTPVVELPVSPAPAPKTRKKK